MSRKRLSQKNEARLMEMAAEIHFSDIFEAVEALGERGTASDMSANDCFRSAYIDRVEMVEAY